MVAKNLNDGSFEDSGLPRIDRCLILAKPHYPIVVIVKLGDYSHVFLRDNRFVRLTPPTMIATMISQAEAMDRTNNTVPIRTDNRKVATTAQMHEEAAMEPMPQLVFSLNFIHEKRKRKPTVKTRMEVAETNMCFFLGGRGGIRTHGPPLGSDTLARCCLKPLDHSSVVNQPSYEGVLVLPSLSLPCPARRML